MSTRIRHRWMATMAAFTLVVTLLFALLAMAFVYTVEDRFLERTLHAELQRQLAHHRAHGRWREPLPGGPWVVERAQDLPPDLADTLRREPERTEVAGEAGRHYHLVPLQEPGRAPWLVAEVSGQLIVRPLRPALLAWLAGWGGLGVLSALLLGAWLARRVTTPLETLARRVAGAEPAQLPEAVAQGLGDDEVGAVGRAFDALLARTRAFVAREQAFTRDASHELRTPLAVLRLQIERLQADTATPAALRQQLTALHAATLLMQQTVETLLLMAREPAGPGGGPLEATAALPPLPVPLLPVLPLAERWVLAHAEWLDHQPLRLELALRRDDALALPEPVLQLALASLLGNAFAHGSPGGTVRVALEPGALVVSNPGAAPPPDATTPGSRGEHSSGFGLGLAILQRLLQRHGAQLVLAHADGVMRASVAVPGAWPRGRPSAPAAPT